MYSEADENNQVVTETTVHRNAMFASPAVGAEGGANAISAETPVIGAAAATPKAPSSDKAAKKFKCECNENEKFPSPIKRDYPIWEMVLVKRLEKSLKGFQL